MRAATDGTDRVFVSVASNINPDQHIPGALASLHAQWPIVAASRFYITAPIDRPEQGRYWNGAVRLDARRFGAGPERFRDEVLRKIEADAGRTRSHDRSAARSLDLDILLWGDCCFDLPSMVLPDPDILERVFLARCLVEMEPDIILPGSAQPLAALVPEGAWAIEAAPFEWVPARPPG